MSNIYGVLQMPSGDLASKQAIKAAGCTHMVIAAPWDALQTTQGGAINSTNLAKINTDFAQAAQVGLKIMFEIQLHYAPTWVLTAVERFKNQDGNTWNGATAESGMQVANWMWTTLGRTYVTDFVTKLATGIGSNISRIDAVKTAGGYYGELHYPSAYNGTGNSFYGFGTSMQTGTGLAGDQVVCPLPGYIPFGVGNTDSQDSTWVNWYINGLITWAKSFIAIQRTAGFTADYHVCIPGYGIRDGLAHSTVGGYQLSAALGEDPRRVIAALAHDPRVWPYSTWLNTSDGVPGGTVDSDKAAWKKIAEEAQRRNKHFRLWGENTSGETSVELAHIFAGDPNGSAMSGATYAGAPPTPPKFNGLFWLSYDSLVAGGSNATLADLATAIAAHP
jgi:hypothetical protein